MLHRLAAVLIGVTALRAIPVAAADVPKATDMVASTAASAASAAAAATTPDTATAEADGDASGVITIIGAREGGMGLSYRAAIAGQRAVDEARAALAPQADVVFTVYRQTPASASAGAAGWEVGAQAVRVSLLANDAETLVTSDGRLPFKFPVDENLQAQDARILVRGAGAQPVVWFSIHGPVRAVGYGDQQFPAHRLGDARLLCVFQMAAHNEMATGASWLVAKMFGRFACSIPVRGADPAQHRVWLIERGRKTQELAERKGQFIYPTYISSYSDDAFVVTLPKDLPAPMTVSYTGAPPEGPERKP